MLECLAEAAPRLRCLGLKVTLDGFDGSDDAGQNEETRRWLDEMPNAPRAVPPLVCLRLHFTRVARYLDCGDGEYSPLEFEIPQEEIEEEYNAGAETRKKLPRWCADIMPTLKYIAVAGEDPSWDDECDDDSGLEGGVRCGDWPSAGERYGGDADEYELQDGWYAVKVKTLQWWRVERTVVEGKRTTELRPIASGVGQDVQNFIEKADQGSSFDRIDELLL